MLYSPAGDKHLADGGLIWSSSLSSCIKAATWEDVNAWGVRLVMSKVEVMRLAMEELIPLSLFIKNCSIVDDTVVTMVWFFLLFICKRFDKVMLLRLLGWGNISIAAGGIWSDRLSKSAWNDFLLSRWHWKSSDSFA